MAECKDIDKALANLAQKVDISNQCCEANKRTIADLNNRLGNLERGNKPNSQKDKPQDLTELYKRLSKAEKDILELGGVVKNVIDDIKEILDSIDEHNQTANESQNIFSNILNFFIDE